MTVIREHIANLRFLSSVSKGRKPKFELHLKIYDLNNVPLISGTSSIKWYLSHSIHAEHRGRTPKCPIANHRVEFNHSKVVSGIRIAIDKNNHLAECPIEFEVSQEFSMAAGGGGAGRDEKITLGTVRLNLSEYIEESENLVREAPENRHARRKSSAAGLSPTSASRPSLEEEADWEEGIVRRHLMQDSKINSTLKIGILMFQIDGERNYIAPALKTAPVFGGIAGIMSGDPVEQEEGGQMANISKSRDISEVQDVYRRALAASWAGQPGELPADECIEDIFGGGDGWKTAPTKNQHRPTESPDEDNSSNPSDEGGLGGTLRPRDIRRMHEQHHRQHSGLSEKSVMTVTGRDAHERGLHRRDRSKEDLLRVSRNRSESMTSLTPTMGSSERGREHGFKRHREVDECEMREDMVAWSLPGAVA